MRTLDDLEARLEDFKTLKERRAYLLGCLFEIKRRDRVLFEVTEQIKGALNENL